MKSMKRAERRRRSNLVWMRRLRQDWNEHGWKRNPQYDYRLVNGDVVCVLSERTSLCACFDLRDREALRFKDTPNRSSDRRKCRDRYRTGRANAVPIQERRAAPVDRERHGSRGKRRPSAPRRVTCACGYLLGIQSREGKMRWLERRPRCPDCLRRYLDR